MTKTTGVREVPIPETTRSVCDSSSHPFDEWLRKELVQQFSVDDAETLPPELASLARRLEEALGSSDAEEELPETDADKAASNQPTAGDNKVDGGKRYEP